MAGRKKRPLATVLIVLGLVIMVVVAALGIWFWQSPLAVYESATRRSLASLGLEKMELETEAGTLVYWQGGQGPTLVLVHGAGHQAGAWSEAAKGLMDRYRLVILDLPGHGESDPSDGPLCMSALYAGVEAVLNGEILDEPPTLVGNSLGAWLGMLYAHRNPDGLERLVAVNGGAVLNDPGDLNLLPATRAEARHLVNGLRDPSSPYIPNFVLDDLVDRSSDGPVARMMLDMEGMQEYVLNERIAEITTPVDLLWGESDQFMDMEYAAAMDSMLPRSRLTHIGSCGHIPHTECPERFLEIFSYVLDLGPPRLPAELDKEE